MPVRQIELIEKRDQYVKCCQEYINATYCIHAAAYFSYYNLRENMNMNAFHNEISQKRKLKNHHSLNYHQISASLMINELNRSMRDSKSTMNIIPHLLVQLQTATLWIGYYPFSTPRNNEQMLQLKDTFFKKHYYLRKEMSEEDTVIETSSKPKEECNILFYIWNQCSWCHHFSILANLPCWDGKSSLEKEASLLVPMVLTLFLSNAKLILEMMYLI